MARPAAVVEQVAASNGGEGPNPPGRPPPSKEAPVTVCGGDGDWGIGGGGGGGGGEKVDATNTAEAAAVALVATEDFARVSSAWVTSILVTEMALEQAAEASSATRDLPQTAPPGFA